MEFANPIAVPQPRKLSRSATLQQVLSMFEKPRYLEIGVARGVTFQEVKADRKVGVDPKFKFDVEGVLKAEPNAALFQITSDEYFGSKPVEQFDVIFLDGLHSFEQTLRDLLNATLRLAPKGVILIDDVRPNSYPASLVDREQFHKLRAALNIKSGAWMGDVYRLVFFIDTFMQGWTYRTVRENHGQTVMWQQRRPSVTDREVSKIAALDYGDTITQRHVYQDAPISEILELLRSRP
jgi:hypothetical protein